MQFSEAIPIFLNEIADELLYRTKQLVKNPQRITAFTEFFGDHSFAGSHCDTDVKQLKLFDIFLFKTGFIKPQTFVDTYGDMSCAAEVVWEGILTEDFVHDVKSGAYNLNEGVIVKGDDFMVKIKTDDYFKRLKSAYPSRWELYGE